MITEQLILNYIQQGIGIPVIEKNGNMIKRELAVGEYVKECFFDVRANPRIFYDRRLKYIGDTYFEDENGGQVQTFCAALVLDND